MEVESKESAILSRSDIRREALAARDGLDPLVRERLSREAIENLKEYLQTTPAEFLHCYISFRSEVDTRYFIEEVLERGLRIIVPVVEELDGQQFLVHTEITGLHALRQGTYGLDEPIERTSSVLDKLNAVVVPLSAFDRQGNRLGYGKGFYDRFLRDLPRTIPRIGLAFSMQESDAIPPLSHDERLDVVITEREIIYCNPSE